MNEELYFILTSVRKEEHDLPSHIIIPCTILTDDKLVCTKDFKKKKDLMVFTICKTRCLRKEYIAFDLTDK